MSPLRKSKTRPAAVRGLLYGLLVWSFLAQPTSSWSASTYVWYGFIFDSNYIDRTTPNSDPNAGRYWNNANNWLVYSPGGTFVGESVPSGDISDKVTIKSYGNPYVFPDYANGTVAELRFIGMGASTSGSNPSAISVTDVLEFNGTAGSPTTFGPLRIILGANGVLLYDGGTSGLGNATIENYGLAQAPAVSGMLSGGTIINHGTFELNEKGGLGTCFVGFGCTMAFHNVGYLTKIDPTGTSEVAANMTNFPSGVVEVKGGRLYYVGGSFENQGEIRASSREATLEVTTLSAPAKLVMATGSRFVGPGALKIGYLLEVTGDSSVENLSLTGNLRGPGRLTLRGKGDLAGSIEGTWDANKGVLDASPVLVITNDCTMSVRGETLLNRRLENLGTIRTESPLGLGQDFEGRAGALVNMPGGLVEGLPPGKGYTGWSDGVVTNLGTLRIRNAAPGVGQIKYVNAGKVEVLDGNFTPAAFEQTAGEINVASNAYVTLYGPSRITGGVVSGSGAIRFSEPTTVAGTIRPGNPLGRLQIVGGSSAGLTSLSSEAVLEIEIGGRTLGSEYDQLIGDGGERSPTLAGLLRVRLVNGFTPAGGDVFTVVTHWPDAVVGTFDRYDLPSLPDGLQWVMRYDRDGLRLSVVQPLKLDATFRAPGKSLVLAWPTNSLGPVILESTESLDPANWQPVKATVRSAGGVESVEVTVDEQARGAFYRLRRGP